MDLHPSLQRAFDRIELVSGSIGDPDEGRMCLMSLVAFLAGEQHSDAPGCASPLIQTFAVVINDHMPHASAPTAEAVRAAHHWHQRRLRPSARRDPAPRLGRRKPRQGVWPVPDGARTPTRKALAASAPLALAPQGRTSPSALSFRRRRRQPRQGGGAPDRTVGAPRPVWRRAGTALGRGHRVAGQAVRRGRVGAARAGHTGRAPGAAREHGPIAPARVRTGEEKGCAPPPVMRMGTSAELGRSRTDLASASAATALSAFADRVGSARPSHRHAPYARGRQRRRGSSKRLGNPRGHTRWHLCPPGPGPRWSRRASSCWRRSPAGGSPSSGAAGWAPAKKPWPRPRRAVAQRSSGLASSRARWPPSAAPRATSPRSRTASWPPRARRRRPRRGWMS